MRVNSIAAQGSPMSGLRRRHVDQPVGYDRQSGCYQSSSWLDYHSDMSDGIVSTAWADYLKRVTTRDDWSVRRLAREAGRHPSTIWDWMAGGTGEKVTVESINAIATATGDHPLDVFRAAAGLVAEEPEDEAIGLVLQSKLDDDEKERMIRKIMARKYEDSERRMQDTVEMIRLASGGKGERTA